MYGMGHIGKIEQICTDEKNERKEYTVHKGKIGNGEPACTIKHPGTVTLETERLILRRFVIADIEPFYRNIASDPNAFCYLNKSFHKNTYVTKNSIERWIADTESPDGYIWCIELKEINEAIGSILITHLDRKCGIARIGYYIGSKFWNRGYTTEALSAVLAFMFEKVGVIRMEAEYDVENPASGRVMEKCGMKYERIRKNGAVNNRGVCDTAVCGMYFSDYEFLKNNGAKKD